MRCVAVLDIENHPLDTVIVWEQDGRLVAYGYQAGEVTQTRPLAEGTDLTTDLNSLAADLLIKPHQLLRAARWGEDIKRELVAPETAPGRWQ